MTDQIKETAQEWAEAVATMQPDTVLKLYHPEAVLWGTLSPVMRSGYDEIREYFVTFLDKPALSCPRIEGKVRLYGDIAFYSGDYEFTWQLEGTLYRLPARFSWVYKKNGDRWMILEHHSSMFPELPLSLEKLKVDKHIHS